MFFFEKKISKGKNNFQQLLFNKKKPFSEYKMFEIEFLLDKNLDKSLLIINFTSKRKICCIKKTWFGLNYHKTWCILVGTESLTRKKPNLYNRFDVLGSK